MTTSLEYQIKSAKDAISRIEVEAEKQKQSIEAKNGKIMQVVTCDKVLCISFEGICNKTERMGGFYGVEKGMGDVSIMRKAVDEAFAGDKAIHEKNIAAIENNIKFKAAFESMMLEMGFQKTFGKSEWKRGKMKHKSFDSGWVSDLNRLCIITDGFSRCENQFKSLVSRIDEYERAQKVAIQAKKNAEAIRDREEKNLRAKIEFQIKFNLDANADWGDIYDVVSDNGSDDDINRLKEFYTHFPDED